MRNSSCAEKGYSLVRGVQRSASVRFLHFFAYFSTIFSRFFLAHILQKKKGVMHCLPIMLSVRLRKYELIFFFVSVYDTLSREVCCISSKNFVFFFSPVPASRRFALSTSPFWAGRKSWPFVFVDFIFLFGALLRLSIDFTCRWVATCKIEGKKHGHCICNEVNRSK